MDENKEEADKLMQTLNQTITEKYDVKKVKSLITEEKQKRVEIIDKNELNAFETKIQSEQKENKQLKLRLKQMHDKMDEKYDNDCNNFENKCNDYVSKMDKVQMSDVVDNTSIKSIDDQIVELVSGYKAKSQSMEFKHEYNSDNDNDKTLFDIDE
eukprot:118560_1